MNKKAKEYTQSELLERASTYCARGERCISQVKQKLYGWGGDPAWTGEIIAYLLEHRFIDERRFARAFARDKYRLSGWGTHRIQSELRRLQIPSQHISEALTELLEEEESPREQLLKILETKSRSISQSLESRKRKERLLRHAAYKGYSYSDAIWAIERLLQGGDDLDDFPDSDDW